MVEREGWVRALAQNREEGRGISLVSFVSFLLISRWRTNRLRWRVLLMELKLTRFRGARQAFNGGFSDAQDASALFT